MSLKESILENSGTTINSNKKEFKKDCDELRNKAEEFSKFTQEIIEKHRNLINKEDSKEFYRLTKLINFNNNFNKLKRDLTFVERVIEK